MTYRLTTQRNVRAAPSSLGARLGKLAVKRGLSVAQIALLTGASRTTIYSWFAGGTVTNAYRRTVEDLITQLRLTSTEQLMETFSAHHTPNDEIA
jgi:transcriptional regulator with XRE-family HTH domain